MSLSHSMLITRTDVHSFGILKIPIDIIVNALCDQGYNPEHCLQKSFFYEYAHFSDPKGSPDMISVLPWKQITTKTTGNFAGFIDPPKTINKSKP